MQAITGHLEALKIGDGDASALVAGVAANAKIAGATCDALGADAAKTGKGADALAAANACKAFAALALGDMPALECHLLKHLNAILQACANKVRWVPLEINFLYLGARGVVYLPYKQSMPSVFYAAPCEWIIIVGY
jgi:hypothetical protein